MMTNEITTRKAAKPPAIMTREAGTLIDLMDSRLKQHHVWPPHYSISSDQAPTTTQRGVLEARKAELEAAFIPADEKKIAEMIAVLRQPFPTGKDIDQKTVLKLYVEVLKTFPEWVIARACRQFMTGEVGEGRFAPTPPEIVKQCAALMTSHRAQLIKINRILNAEIRQEPTPEERERVGARMAELRKSFLITETGAGEGEAA